MTWSGDGKSVAASKLYHQHRTFIVQHYSLLANQNQRVHSTKMATNINSNPVLLLSDLIRRPMSIDHLPLSILHSIGRYHFCKTICNPLLPSDASTTLTNNVLTSNITLTNVDARNEVPHHCHYHFTEPEKIVVEGDRIDVDILSEFRNPSHHQIYKLSLPRKPN